MAFRRYSTGSESTAVPVNPVACNPFELWGEERFLATRLGTSSGAVIVAVTETK